MQQEDAFEIPDITKGRPFNGIYEDQKILWGEPLPDDKKFSMKDEVNHPEHYASGGIECLDAMEAMANQSIEMKIELKGHDYYLWQVIFKYLWRFPYKKDPLTDIEKLLFYLKKLKSSLETQKYENK